MPAHFIHVDQHAVKANHKDPSLDLPVFTVKRGKSGRAVKARHVRILGPAELVYAGPGQPPILSCGARVVLCTNSAVEVTV